MLLVDWLAAARDAGLLFEVRLRGGPDPDRPAHWAAVQRRLQEEGLQERVHVDGWLVGDAVYSGLDAIVVPSDCPDPLPRVVLEAGSRGLPVIAFPSGGIPSMIVDRKTGFLVSGSSEFISVLANLIGSPDVCHSVGVAAREHIAVEFALRRFYERLDVLYAELSRQRPTRRATVPQSRVGS
jgi:glycosyltransferase involved in cell wall biosynthesis